MAADRKKTAFTAAVSYLGLSSSTKDFPKGVEVEIITNGEPPADDDGFFNELRERIDSLWRDNVGTLSKVSRMSNIDFAHYVNELRMERGAKALEVDSPLIERWMRMFVAVDRKVVLVRVNSSEGERLILVRTK